MSMSSLNNYNDNEKRMIFENMIRKLTLDDLYEAFPSLFIRVVVDINNNINNIFSKDVIIHILNFTNLEDTLRLSYL